MKVRALLRRVPGARWAASRRPSVRRAKLQWDRIRAVVNCQTVQSGPFAGMVLTPEIPHFNKRIGCDEAELHPLIESWSGYDRVIDVGCAHGWYAVGLARRMPSAKVWAFDTEDSVLRICRDLATSNGVDVETGGEQTPASLAGLVKGRTLIVVDIEGAEVDLLNPSTAPGLRNADILVEMHDFCRPGATELIKERFTERQITVFEPTARDPSEYPLLASLSRADQRRAVDENRAPGQRWLWMPSRQGENPSPVAP